MVIPELSLGVPDFSIEGIWSGRRLFRSKECLTPEEKHISTFNRTTTNPNSTAIQVIPIPRLGPRPSNHSHAQITNATAATRADKLLPLLCTRGTPSLLDLLMVMPSISADDHCVTLPYQCSWWSSLDMVVRIVVERPAGQKMTSKPPPDGIMKVEV